MAQGSQAHEDLVNRLNSIVNSLTNPRPNVAVAEGGGVNDSLARLFPSARGNTQGSSNVISSSPSTAQSSRLQYNSGRAFQRSKSKSSRQKQPYGKSSKPSAPVMKDVILLPNPKMSAVPRGRIREELYVRKLVVTAEISNEMTGAELKGMFAEFFSRCLRGRDFEVVRAVGNKIVQPNMSENSQTGRVLKHISGQGPVYLRSKTALESDFSWYSDEEEEEEDQEDGKEESDKYEKKHKTDAFYVVDDDDDDYDDDLKQVIDYNPSTTVSKSVPGLQTTTSSTMLSPLTSTGASSSTSTSTGVSLSPSTSTGASQASTVMCPTCHRSFSLSFIEEHADICCDMAASTPELAYCNLMLTMERDTLHDEPQDDESMPQEEKSELKDVMERIAGRVTKKNSYVNIQRKFILEDYIEGRKRPWIKPENVLVVCFVGEPAVDDGGPKREFFTEILQQVKRRLFIEEQQHGGYVPCESTVALTEGSFEIAGELMAMSLAQGGPAPNFLAPWVYDYLSTGLDGVVAEVEKMEESQFKVVAQKIMAVNTEETLKSVLMEEECMDILSKVGYRGVPQREKLKNKCKLARSIYIKVYIEPKIPMLSQMAKGLQLFNVLDEVTKNKEEMRKIFTWDSFEDLTADSLFGLMSVEFSLAQQLKETEIRTYKAFRDFIHMIEYEGMSKYEISLADVLKFITGCSQVPPLGFCKKISVTFINDCAPGCQCRPTASTCSLHLILPTHLQSYEDMTEAGISMLKECFGFGSI